ncbi:UDP-glucosyltransferase 29-like [Salvia miltiorrhiza]|uniref:UDP-glucosyltransferase 29-like n=1 Tax=Salvia miltiorrhiza TaxID=226208 RepID=UPI0025AD35BE|nr:UDP-glucosyltransferase 29-like [Salvia miltiorrhiza]
MDSNSKTLKILMFPFIAHGHITPFLELAKKLSSRNFHIYFCSTSVNLDFIKDTLTGDSSYRIEPVELHLPSLPQLPPKFHTTKNIPPHLRPLLMQAFQQSSSSFSTLLSKLSPNLLIYDVLQPWAAKLAAAEGIPAVLFFTGGAAAGSLLHHWHSRGGSFEDFPFEELSLREHEKRGLVASKRFVKVEDEELGFLFGVFELSRDVVLIKSCRGVEGKYMDYLSTLCERKLVATGPLITRGGDGGGEIMEWLSMRERGSTLYISFGSENFMSEKEMVEIAKGLEMVEVGFIWVARPPGGAAAAAVPEGFAERVKGRGMVVERWAPQAAILAHPSVGGFMSHCGWSSITESLYFGVPVVALPLKIDQPGNARLVVAAGAGVEVERDEEGGFGGEAVARAVRAAVVEGGEGMRRRAAELGERMRVEEDGGVEEVVEELSRICMKK